MERQSNSTMKFEFCHPPARRREFRGCRSQRWFGGIDAVTDETGAFAGYGAQTGVAY